MSNTKPRVLITGATGQIGRQVVAKLAGDLGLDTIASSRNPEKANLGVPTVLLDYDRGDTVAPALQGVDRLFILTGYTVDMLRQSKELVDGAQKAGVKHIVHLGACGADDTDVAHYGWHQFVERYIAGSGIAYTHLRPEIFMENILGYGGVPAASNGVLRYYVGNQRLSFVAGEDIAEVAAAVLRSPGDHTGQTYRLGYDAKTYGEVAAIIAHVIQQPFRYEAHAAEEFLNKVLKAGGEPAYMHCVYSSFARFSGDGLPGADEVFDNFTAITGRAPTTVEGFIRKHADAFRY